MLASHSGELSECSPARAPNHSRNGVGWSLEAPLYSAIATLASHHTLMVVFVHSVCTAEYLL